MRTIRIFLVVLIPIAALLMAIFYPYASSLYAAAAFLLTLVGTFSTAGLAYAHWRSKPALRVPLVMAGALSVSAYFVCTTRQIFDEIIPLQLDGRIQSLYRSHNHQYPGVELEDSFHRSIRVEPIPETSWTVLRVGDHVSKKAFSTDFMRDGERIPAVEHSFLHTIRGARP